MKQVYKATPKGLRLSGEMEATDRYLFTDKSTALIYDSNTFNIIEPFGLKSKDCYVEIANEEIPTELFITPSLLRMYKLKDIMEVQKILEITFTK